MTWLVTGGAGYIGSHVVRAFLQEGIDCVVLDDLSSGHRDFVPESVPLVVGSLVDRPAVDEALDGRNVSGVVHLAGFKYAGVSVSRPLHTYTQNVTGTVILLEGMVEHGVDKIVFSSSAAVYGTPETDLVTEASPTRPESPYGESKLIGEWLLRDQAKAATLRHTALRYFNVVGSGDSGAARHQPAQPVSDHLRPAGRGKGPLHQRRRLPDSRRHLCPRLRARRRSGDLARGGGQGAGGRRRSGAGVQPGQR